MLVSCIANKTDKFSMGSLARRTLESESARVFVTGVMIVTWPFADYPTLVRLANPWTTVRTCLGFMVFHATTRSISSPFFLHLLVPRFELLTCINTFAHLQRILVAMPVTPSSVPSEPSQDRIPDSEAAEILRLKRKLAATHQELDEARGSRPKKIPWVSS